MAYVIHAYQAGLTVAIANATQDQANLFEALVDGEPVASCTPDQGESQIALYGLRQTVKNRPGQATRYCLPDFVDSDEQIDKHEEAWLSDEFAQGTPQPPLPSTDIVSSNDSVNLDSLSMKTHCSEFYAKSSAEVQDDFFVTSLRSFDQQRDYYYVNDFAQSYIKATNYDLQVSADTPLIFDSDSAGDLSVLNGASLLFTEPGTTTEYVSGYTNDKSTTVSGSVGFGDNGFNVEKSKSVTVGTSTTVSIPPVAIYNRSSLSSASPFWDLYPANPVPNVLFDVAAGWVWSIDRDVYGSAPDDVPEVLDYFHASVAATRLRGLCGFPTPFPTFTVGAPEITSVDPTTVQRGGGSFIIHGTQMYPGIITNVLLGGDALPSANFAPISDKEIRVVVPSGQKKGAQPVQVNTSLNGTIMPSNTNVTVNIK